jgi:dephospho-CoA kinase
MTRDDVMEAFGEKAFLLLRVDKQALGVIGWKVENLVACTDDVYIDSNVSFAEALGAMMSEVERASGELQCEISLLFLPVSFRIKGDVFQTLGYQQRTIKSLGVRAWEEAAQESMPPDSLMLFRVLRPV